MFTRDQTRPAAALIVGTLAVSFGAADLRAEDYLLSCGESRTTIVTYQSSYYQPSATVVYDPAPGYVSYEYRAAPSYIAYVPTYARPVRARTRIIYDRVPLRRRTIVYNRGHYRSRYGYYAGRRYHRPWYGHSALRYGRSGYLGRRHHGYGFRFHVPRARHNRHLRGFSIRFGR